MTCCSEPWLPDFVQVRHECRPCHALVSLPYVFCATHELHALLYCPQIPDSLLLFLQVGHERRPCCRTIKPGPEPPSGHRCVYDVVLLSCPSSRLWVGLCRAKTIHAVPFAPPGQCCLLPRGAVVFWPSQSLVRGPVRALHTSMSSSACTQSCNTPACPSAFQQPLIVLASFQRRARDVKHIMSQAAVFPTCKDTCMRHTSVRGQTMS